MKMKELEKATGVGRETIRFYIREGLLPEPERPKRNVARYSEEHVERLKLIKQLQQERFLPLNVIKHVMHARDQKSGGPVEPLIGLEEVLYPLLADPDGLKTRPFEEAAAAFGLSGDDAEELIEMELVHVEMREDGTRWIDHRNARLLQLWADVRAAGFTNNISYGPRGWQRYAEFIKFLVDDEVATFYRNLGDRFDQKEAAKLAAAGIRLINEILPLMRTDAILREVQAISQRGSLKPDEDGKG